MEEMLTRQIEKQTEAPRNKDILKLEELLYNALMGGEIAGMYSGQLRVEDNGVRLAASPPNFAPTDAIKFMLQRLALPPEVLNTIQLKVATYSSKLAILTGYDGFRRVKELFARALEQGYTQREFFQEVGTDGILQRTGFLKEDPWYLENVFRTNLSTAYNAGNWDSYQRNVDEIAYYEYSAINDNRTTPLCESLDGTIRKTSDPIWSNYWPPNHYQCRSEVIAISKVAARVLNKTQTDLPPASSLEFEKGNESFRGNSAKDFGELSKDQKRRAREMGVMDKMNKRSEEIIKRRDDL